MSNNNERFISFEDVYLFDYVLLQKVLVQRLLEYLTSSPYERHRGNYRRVAPRRVDISHRAATFAVVLCLPTCPFKVSVCPPATNIFLAAFSSPSCLAPQLKHSHSRIDKSNFPRLNPQQEQRCGVPTAYYSKITTIFFRFSF